MSADILAQLAATPSNIVHEQKLIDAADFFDARNLMIATGVLRQQSRVHPRQWEFTAAFEGLRRAGVLQPDRRGLTFGSGREPLIFPVANAVSHLTVTDLYSGSTNWKVARTETPHDFVMSAAPKGFDPSRITVRALDMREIDLPDGSIDFCYSISTFEHIGTDADFLKHLRGVARVLKPGGVYALTTEVRLGDRTFDLPGNHCFKLDHLFRLFEDAGLQPGSVFDARLTPVLTNAPNNLPDLLHYDGSHPNALTVREFGGVIAGPAIFMLRPGTFRKPDVLGLEETIAWCEQQLQARTRRRFRQWLRFNPFGQFAGAKSPWCEPWAGPGNAPAEGSAMFSTGYHFMGSGEIEARLVIVASPETVAERDMEVAVNSWSRLDRVKRERTATLLVKLGPGEQRVQQVSLRFKVEPSSSYAIFAHQRGGNDLRLALVDVMAKYAGRSA